MEAEDGLRVEGPGGAGSNSGLGENETFKTK
jgi:hypothetical protein